MAAPSKKILGLTLLLSVVAFSQCQVKFSSLPGERNYRVDWEGFEVNRELTKEYFTWHMARIGLTERSKDRIYVLNANFTLHKKFPKDAWMTVIAYQRTANNDYSLIPVRVISAEVCDVMKIDQFFTPSVLNHTNFPRKCPGDEGEYFIRDLRIDDMAMPPEFPGERWKLVYIMKTNVSGEDILQMTGYLLLNRYV